MLAHRQLIPRFLFAVVLLALSAPAPRSFPPAPHHLVYGMVRDEYGRPLNADSATIIFETATGVAIRGAVAQRAQPSVNYEVTIPMDSGITADAYKPNALRPFVQFRIKVRIGSTDYLPIEMDGDLASLGHPAEKTRLDLTLGVDSDGDGVPDAWEQLLIASLGGGLGLEDINPNDDFDGDGLSNLAEYIAGTYAHDPEDGFELAIAGFGARGPLLDFVAIRSRSYSVYGSADLQHWTLLNFYIPAEGTSGVKRQVYNAADERLLRIEAILPDETGLQFFKLQVH